MAVALYGNGAADMWFHFDPPPGVDMFPVEVFSAGQLATRTTRYVLDTAAMSRIVTGDYYGLQYTLSGSGRVGYRDNGRKQEYEVPAGHFFMIEHDWDYEFRFPGGSGWEWLYIMMRGELARRVFAAVSQQQRVWSIGADSAPITMIRTLLAKARSNNIDHFSLLSTGCEFLVKLQEETERSVMNPGDLLRREAAEYVGEHLSTVTVDELASAWGYNTKYFQSYFKRQTGETPGAFIQSLRLDKAATLLRNTVTKISAIADETGFTDGSHFCRVFKTHFGVSPENWRQRQDRRGPFRVMDDISD